MIQMVDEYFRGKGRSEKKYSEQFSSPTWDGERFGNPKAQTWWEEYPNNLRTIVLAELEAGNSIWAILKNHNRNIVLVSLSKIHQTKILESTDIIWHKIGKYGNYLYDGTSSTIEDIDTGCFTAFDDPEYEKDW